MTNCRYTNNLLLDSKLYKAEWPARCEAKIESIDIALSFIEALAFKMQILGDLRNIHI